MINVIGCYQRLCFYFEITQDFVFILETTQYPWVIYVKAHGYHLLTSDPTPGNLSKETQNTNLKEDKHPCVHCSIIYNRQDREAAQVPISRWVGKTALEH